MFRPFMTRSKSGNARGNIARGTAKGFLAKTSYKSINIFMDMEWFHVITTVFITAAQLSDHYANEHGDLHAINERGGTISYIVHWHLWILISQNTATHLANGYPWKP